jgi:tetratricopeptide (TPR) repeat protein/tRNA A-37 threonylcarbamoyl transferase component Bud32
MSSLHSGQALLHYHIINRIGAGGMGEVYRAEDLKLGRQVAIKVLPARETQDQTARQRFLREARSASALNHPHIVTIHAIEESDGMDFIVMEYVEGETLRAKVGRGPVGFELVLDLGTQVADALAAAHAIGLVHRDIKSANILVTSRGQAKVVDFGLAKMAQPLSQGLDTEAATLSGSLTATGMIVGTVAYMSPEQTRGEALDARSDIFSLGCVLYEAATGRLPFSGPSVLSMMHEIATLDPSPPSAIERDVPREFDFIIERALAKDKERRYSSAAELARALQELSGSASAGLSGLSAAIESARSEGEAEAFVGREPELRRLDEFLRQTLAGSGQVIFLTGEPGIGKTSLAAEFLRRVRREHPAFIVCRGRCVEQYGTGEAYLPFLDALGALLSSPGRERILTALRTYAPTWCLQFPAAFSSGAQEQLQRETIGATKERMLREMGDALSALAGGAPVILLLEDLHWADPSSTDLLRHLCQRIEGQRLLIIGTFRPEDLERSHHPLRTYKLEMQTHKLCEEIALEMLGEEQITSYLNARFAPNRFSRELAAFIQHKTEGNPLFATSLAQFLAERGDIAKAHEHWALTRPLAEVEVEAPESVRSMIGKKIAALDEEDRRALQYASIEGEEFTSTVLAHLLGVDDLALEEQLDRLDKVHRWIQTRGEEELPDGTLGMRYRFAHALYQNVLYGDLVSKRRILLHRQAGEQLIERYGDEATGIATQLALHFERGRNFSRAVEYLIQAGDNATKVYANAEAEEHYSHALSLIAKLPIEEQSERYLTIYEKHGAVNFALARIGAAEDDFTRMLERARALEAPALETVALNGLLNAFFWSNRPDEFAERAGEALRAAERTGSEALRLEVMVRIAFKQTGYGELVKAKPLADEIIRIARSIEHKPALLGGLLLRGHHHFFQSEYKCAEETLTPAASVASELRDGFSLLNGLLVLGWTLGNLGRMSEALAALHEAMDMAQRNGDRFFFARLPNSFGWIYHELQDFDRAFEHNQQGVEIAHGWQILEPESNSLINLGYDYLHTGESEKTLPAFREAEIIFKRDALGRWRYNIRLQAGQAEYWLAQGNPEQAAEYAHRLLEIATHYEARKYIAVAHKLLAEVAIARGELAEAEAEFNAALDLLREYPVPIVAWKVYAALGRLRLQLGESQAAREAFTQAMAIINQIAASVNDDQLRATFLNSPAVREVLDESSEVSP